MNTAPPADPGITLIVSAMPIEIAPLLRAMAGSKRRDGVWRGQLGAHPVAVAVTGEGERCARQRLERVLTDLAVPRLVVLGVSGGIAPDLVRGDLLIGHTVRHADHDRPVPAPDPILLATALKVLPARAATLITSAAILATPAHKRALFETAGQPAGAAVDLETAAFAEVAARHAVPYVVLRAVSDAAGDALPLDVERMRGADGHIAVSRIVRHVLRHPTALRPLLELRRTVMRCAATLARATVTLLDQIAAEPSPPNNTS